MKIFAAAFLLLAGIASSAAAQPCHDVRRGEPAALTGELTHRVLPGPPNYKDVQRGDRAEPTWLLRLDAPICIEDGDVFADPGKKFDVVHVVPMEAMEHSLEPFRDRRVTVSIVYRMPAHTWQHKAPLVAVVDKVALEREVPENVPEDVPEDAPEDVPEVAPEVAPEEEGTSAAVVRGFYLALGAGDGDEAASFVIPEKRSGGPLSASAMTGFYRDMERPLELVDMEPLSERTYMVRYRFQKGRLSCNGRAEVTTVERSGRSYIEGIRALDGC